MPRKKKPTTQPPAIETPIEAPVQVETKPETPLEIRKISHEEYLAFGNEKKESEYSRIAKTIIEEALKSDSPIVVKLPQDINARRIVPILAKIVSEMWKSGTKIEFKASYKRNEIAIRVRK